MNSSSRTRCALIGLGHRSHSWLMEMTGTYKDTVEVVGLCDAVIARARDANTAYEMDVPVFADHREMLAKTRPDLVIVIVPEFLHAECIIAALDAGCAVATEKPLCTTGEDAQKILEAEKRAGKRVFMGFNYRYIPLMAKIKELLLDGAIGRPVSMDLTWYLDYKGHGASYFRRWHRQLKNSGGLLITKGSHHLDLANWWMGDAPSKVFARCTRNFFGPGKSPFKGVRCRDCAHAKKCPMYTEVCVKEPDYEKLSQELGYRVRGVRNYLRDACVYGDDVDIYDTHALVVEYKNGGILNYTLNAAVPFEGWNLAINGTNGRLESKITDAKPAAPWVPAEWRKTYKGAVVEWPAEYRVFVMPHDRDAFEVTVPNIADGHGGGDFKMFDALFLGKGVENDRLGLFASARDGALSVAIGDAANRSAASGLPVPIPDLPGSR